MHRHLFPRTSVELSSLARTRRIENHFPVAGGIPVAGRHVPVQTASNRAERIVLSCCWDCTNPNPLRSSMNDLARSLCGRGKWLPFSSVTRTQISSHKSKAWLNFFVADFDFSSWDVVPLAAVIIAMVTRSWDS